MKCLFKDSFWVKQRSHWLQGKGFSPVCIRRWRFIKDLNFMILKHKGHCDWPFSRTIGSIICKNISNILNLFTFFKKQLFFNNVYYENVYPKIVGNCRNIRIDYKQMVFLQYVQGCDELSRFCFSWFCDTKDIANDHSQEQLAQ